MKGEAPRHRGSSRRRVIGPIDQPEDVVVDELVDRIRSIVAGTAAAQGVEADVEVMGQSATLTPDDELINRIVDAAKGLPAVPDIVRTQTLAGSDDANLLIRHVQGRGGQGAYIMIGASSPGPHHSATFDLAEDAIGIDTLEALIRSN